MQTSQEEVSAYRCGCSKKAQRGWFYKCWENGNLGARLLVENVGIAG